MEGLGIQIIKDDEFVSRVITNIYIIFKWCIKFRPMSKTHNATTERTKWRGRAEIDKNLLILLLDKPVRRRLNWWLLRIIFPQTHFNQSNYRFKEVDIKNCKTRQLPWIIKLETGKQAFYIQASLIIQHEKTINGWLCLWATLPLIMSQCFDWLLHSALL